MDPVSGFERIGELSRQMLEAAQANDWQRLEQLDAEMGALRGALQALPRTALQALPSTSRKQIESAIRAALDEQARTRQIIDPWHASLKGLLSARSRQRDLRASYGAFPQAR